MAYYIDDRGYPRDRYDGQLIHRKVAYRMYKRTPHLHDRPFRDYVIHHRNGRKKDFRESNLEILTREEHRGRHGYWTDKDIWDVVKFGAVAAAFLFFCTIFGLSYTGEIPLGLIVEDIFKPAPEPTPAPTPSNCADVCSAKGLEGGECMDGYCVCHGGGTGFEPC
ncbi:hypothetical protein HOD38_00155 [archaeon]|jgi:hypothetical protein|nr:hypothetical protein [archaeon]MBT4396658.1 hypothetical protein [archaeon]MBT4441268.1 hypothetical protein [archaeon]